MSWKNNKWVDDDGSLTVGTPFDAEHMNNIELGIAEDQASAAAAGGVAGSALSKASVAKEIAESTEQTAGSALVTGQQANIRAASGVTAAGSALVTGQQANARAASGVAAAGSALVTGQKANALAASGVAAAGSGVAGVTNLFNMLAAAGMGVVFHGANANAKRPSGFEAVTWIGTVEPTNGVGHEEDVWINPEDFGISSSVFVPTTRVFNSAGQSIPNTTTTVLTFNSERWDNAGIHSTASNTSRLVAPKAGVYEVFGSVSWLEAKQTATWLMAIRVNGTATYGAAWCPFAFQSEHSISTQVKLEAGDYVELCVFQQTGGALLTGAGSFPAPQEFGMTWQGTGTPSLTPVDWGLVTELPAGAGVGDTCSLKVREGESSPWKVWNCVKVESSGERPWAADGPALIFNNTGSPSTASTTYQTSLAPIGAAPLNGEYDVEYGLADFSAVSLSARMGLFVAAVELSSLLVTMGSVGGALPGYFPFRVAMAKGASVAVRYRVEGSGTGQFFGMYIRIKPVRIG